MSIKTKINLVLLLIGSVTFIFITSYNYYQARKRIYADAYQKAELISSYAMASREYTKRTMRPLTVKLAGQDRFMPELMAGFFVTRAIADIFSESQKGYAFKQATLNPILAENKSDEQETQIINYFRENRGAKIDRGSLTKNGEEFFYVARPVVNKQACNKCHGRREDAPKEQLEKYPGSGGYGWKVDEVVATLITYVPINNALAELKKTALITGLVGIVSVAFLMLSTSTVINHIVIKPIANLTEITGKMSRGKELTRSIEGNSNDEIGALYESFNRMRKSVLKLIQILKAKKA